MNLVLSFASILVYTNSTRQENRNNIYLQSLVQLTRVIPKETKLVIIENTGFMNSEMKSKSYSNLRAELQKHEVFSTVVNEGYQNKGLGELSMLSSYFNNFETGQYERAIYLTLRQIHLSPYAIEFILHSRNELVISNPDFYFLDGRVDISMKSNQFNDMCFGGTTAMLNAYSNYFVSQRQRMTTLGISSEQLLMEFAVQTQANYELLPMLGVLRCAGDQANRAFAWHYI